MVQMVDPSSLPYKEESLFGKKFSSFLHLVTNDVASFCWLLSIKGSQDEGQGWKNYGNLLLPK